MKLLRNWEAIAKVNCRNTRYALSVAQDPAVLNRLATGFPECFREGKDDELDRFSWSRILRLAEQHHSASSECRPPYSSLQYMWHYYLTEERLAQEDQDLAGIPIAGVWSTLWYKYESEGSVPSDVILQLQQMQGQVLQGPIFIEYRGVRCVIGCIFFEYGCHELQAGKIFKVTDFEGLYELVLIPADVIVFDL